MSTSTLEARFSSQLLAGERAADTAGVARRLLAVQAQDLRSARLAVRARTRGLTAADVDRALTEERTVVVGWLNRGTLQLVSRDDYWWLHSLTTPPVFRPVTRRLAEMGVGDGEAERGVAAIERALSEDGPLTRSRLGDAVAAANVPTAGQALLHLLFLACLRGIALRGPLIGKQQAYALARDWVGPPPPPGAHRDRSLAELARRYLAGHAPASDRDLAKWAGLPLRDARAGLAAITPELTERDDGLVELAGTPPPSEARACLLDLWDPLLVGWASRDELLALHPGLDDPMAHYQRFAYSGARAVGGWSLIGGGVAIEPFTSLEQADAAALARDAADLVRFLG
jgi:Winged helix DNA-binding domain